MQSFKGSQAGPIVCYSVLVNITPPSLATQVGGYLDVAIPAAPGCSTTQRCLASPDSADIGAAGAAAGYIIVSGARVKAANTVRLQCVNASATNPLAPAALDYNFTFFGKNSG